MDLMSISTEKAIKDSFDKGLAITITEKNNLIKLYPDGEIELIEKLSEEVEILLDKKIFE